MSQSIDVLGPMSLYIVTSSSMTKMRGGVGLRLGGRRLVLQQLLLGAVVG